MRRGEGSYITVRRQGLTKNFKKKKKKKNPNGHPYNLSLSRKSKFFSNFPFSSYQYGNEKPKAKFI
jgi:hypothetical protein